MLLRFRLSQLLLLQVCSYSVATGQGRYGARLLVRTRFPGSTDGHRRALQCVRELRSSQDGAARKLQGKHRLGCGQQPRTLYRGSGFRSLARSCAAAETHRNGVDYVEVTCLGGPQAVEVPQAPVIDSPAAIVDPPAETNVTQGLATADLTRCRRAIACRVSRDLCGPANAQERHL